MIHRRDPVNAENTRQDTKRGTLRRSRGALRQIISQAASARCAS
jgi:hypothetical protein